MDNMDNYVIISDSSTDLTTELVKETGVEIIPLTFLIDGKSYFNYTDEREISTKDFYNLLRDGKVVTTGQVNVNTFLDVFEKHLQEDKDILYIAFSSGLSGTCNSAKIAAKELSHKYHKRKIIVIDSLCASMGEGLLVYLASLKKKEGQSIEEVAKWVQSNKFNLCHWFTVDDLFFLKRGGRVSAAAAVMGTALGIKPVLHVDDEGHLIPVSKVRGRKKSLDALVEQMEKSAIDPQNQTIFISHGDCEQDAEYLAKEIKNKFKVKDIKINNVGPVIGAHSGPGTMALFFLGTQR